MEVLSRSNLVVNKMDLFQRHVSAALGCTYPGLLLHSPHLFHQRMLRRVLAIQQWPERCNGSIGDCGSSSHIFVRCIFKCQDNDEQVDANCLELS
jgi:hypothetical protein